MDNKKFEKLIDLIINENEEQARALFHDIVVEKSRQIYEGLMDEEMGMTQDQSMGMLDELSAQNDAEEQGQFEADEEFDDIEVGDDGMGDEEEVDLDTEEFGDEEGEEELEDRVVDLEDKLDQLMAEFEEIMGQEEGDDMGDDGMGADDMGDEDEQSMMEADGAGAGDEEESLEEAEEEDEDKLEEAIQLKKVSVTHGDNGVQTKSVVAGKNSMISSNGASAANLTKGYQDSGKGGTQGGVLAPTTKDIKHAGAYGNSPNSFKFKEKGEAAPKAKHGDDGQNTKSVIESRKSVKKPVAKATTTKKIVK
jgi:hypothetical protein